MAGAGVLVAWRVGVAVGGTGVVVAWRVGVAVGGTMVAVGVAGRLVGVAVAVGSVVLPVAQIAISLACQAPPAHCSDRNCTVVTPAAMGVQ